jgi:LAS superfamily LD-carboxypeptidase LdcB
MNNIFKKNILIISLLLLLVFVILSFIYREKKYNNNFYEWKNQAEQERKILEQEIFQTKESLKQSEDLVSKLNLELEKRNKEMREILEEFEVLDSGFKLMAKYIETDKELLAKYSKTYFLNENYIPKQISLLNQKYSISPSKEIYIHGQVKSFLEDLIADAEKDGIEIRVVSGYRSFDEQKSLKSNYLVQYGSGANTFSADQGYSEHQLGTAVDFSNPTLGASLTIGFDQSKSFAWLSENAHKYGFILSYPKGNQFYQYEPWHWRFVGRDLARHLYRNKMNFYDMDQREINVYLANIFE